MGDGFAANPEKLRKASDDTRQVMESFPRKRSDRLDCDPNVVGDPETASTITNFCARWSVGIGYLIADGMEVASRLDSIAKTYEDSDQEAAQKIQEAGASGG